MIRWGDVVQGGGVVPAVGGRRGAFGGCWVRGGGSLLLDPGLGMCSAGLRRR